MLYLSIDRPVRQPAHTSAQHPIQSCITFGIFLNKSGEYNSRVESSWNRLPRLGPDRCDLSASWEINFDRHGERYPEIQCAPADI